MYSTYLQISGSIDIVSGDTTRDLQSFLISRYYCLQITLSSFKMKLSPSENGYFTGGDNFSTSDSQSSASDALNHNHIPQNHPNPNHHPNHQQQSSGYPMMNLDEFLEQTSFSGDSPASTSTSGGSVQTESSSLQNIDFR